MTHEKVQKKLLLFLDADLSFEEMQKIRDHLSLCPVCKKKHDALAALWRHPVPPIREAPTPGLWLKVQARIRGNRVLPAKRRTVSGMPAWILQPLGALVLIISILLGLYLGSPVTPAEQVAVQQDNTGVEWGLDHFDMLPPTTLGSSLIEGSAIKN